MALITLIDAVLCRGKGWIPREGVRPQNAECLDDESSVINDLVVFSFLGNSEKIIRK